MEAIIKLTVHSQLTLTQLDVSRPIHRCVKRVTKLRGKAND